MKEDISLTIKPAISRAELRREYALAGKWEFYCLYCSLVLPDCVGEAHSACLIHRAKKRAGIFVPGERNRWREQLPGHLTLAQIGERLGLPSQTIAGWLRRGKVVSVDRVVEVDGIWLVPEALYPLFEWYKEDLYG